MVRLYLSVGKCKAVIMLNVELYMYLGTQLQWLRCYCKSQGIANEIKYLNLDCKPN